MRAFTRILLTSMLWPALASAGLPALEFPKSNQSRPGDAAVVIGTRYYSLPDDGTFLRDARMVAKFLLNAIGLRPYRVSFLDDADPHEIRSALEKQAAVATGTLWVFVALHGLGDHLITRAAKGSYESIKEHSVTRQEIFEIVRRSRAKRVVVIIDACFNGMTRTGRPLTDERFPFDPEAIPPLPENVYVWSAAAPGQFAGTLPDVGHGIFTYFAVGALSGWAADKQGEVSLDGAHSYVVDAVASALSGSERNQTPTINRGSAAPLVAVGRRVGPDLNGLVLGAEEVRPGGPVEPFVGSGPFWLITTGLVFGTTGYLVSERVGQQYTDALREDPSDRGLQDKEDLAIKFGVGSAVTGATIALSGVIWHLATAD